MVPRDSPELLVNPVHPALPVPRESVETSPRRSLWKWSVETRETSALLDDAVKTDAMASMEIPDARDDEEKRVPEVRAENEDWTVRREKPARTDVQDVRDAMESDTAASKESRDVQDEMDNPVSTADPDVKVNLERFTRVRA